MNAFKAANKTGIKQVRIVVAVLTMSVSECILNAHTLLIHYSHYTHYLGQYL